MKSARPFIIVLILLAGACASSPKINISDAEWKGRIGTYTYEQALAELGPPNVVAESNEGRTAEWVISQSPATSFSFGFGRGSYGGGTSTGVGAGTTISPPPGGESLRLRFDKNGNLAEWSKAKY
jgi:uncharacterized membrane protein YgcG